MCNSTGDHADSGMELEREIECTKAGDATSQCYNSSQHVLEVFVPETVIEKVPRGTTGLKPKPLKSTSKLKSNLVRSTRKGKKPQVTKKQSEEGKKQLQSRSSPVKRSKSSVLIDQLMKKKKELRKAVQSKRLLLSSLATADAEPVSDLEVNRPCSEIQDSSQDKAEQMEVDVGNRVDESKVDSNSSSGISDKQMEVQVANQIKDIQIVREELAESASEDVGLISKEASDTNNISVVRKQDDDTDTSGGLKKSLRQCLEEKISHLPTSELLKTFMPVIPLINATFVREGAKKKQKIVPTSMKKDGHSAIAILDFRKSEKKSSSVPQNQDKQVDAESGTQKCETISDTMLLTNTASVDSPSKRKSSPLKTTNKDLIQRKARKKRGFHCTMCELAYIREENLISHMKSTHPPLNLPRNLGNLEQESIAVDIGNDSTVTGETKSIEKSRMIESTQKELSNDKSTLDSSSHFSCDTEGNKYPNDLVHWKLGNIPSKLKQTAESQIKGSVVCVKKLQQNPQCLETDNLTLLPVRNDVWKVQTNDSSASSITSADVAESDVECNKHDVQEVTDVVESDMGCSKLDVKEFVDLGESDMGYSKYDLQEVVDVAESDMGCRKHVVHEVIDLAESDVEYSKHDIQEVEDLAKSGIGCSKHDVQEVSLVLDETDGTVIQIIDTSKVDTDTLEEHIGKEDLLEEMLADDMELVYELDETDGTFKEVVRKKQTSDEDLLERMDDSLAKEVLSDSVAVIDFEKKLVNMDLEKGNKIGNDEVVVISTESKERIDDSLAKEVLSDSVAIIDFKKKLLDVDLQKRDKIENDEVEVIRTESKDKQSSDSAIIEESACDKQGEIEKLTECEIPLVECENKLLESEVSIDLAENITGNVHGNECKDEQTSDSAIIDESAGDTQGEIEKLTECELHVAECENKLLESEVSIDLAENISGNVQVEEREVVIDGRSEDLQVTDSNLIQTAEEKVSSDANEKFSQEFILEKLRDIQPALQIIACNQIRMGTVSVQNIDVSKSIRIDNLKLKRIHRDIWTVQDLSSKSGHKEIEKNPSLVDGRADILSAREFICSLAF